MGAQRQRQKRQFYAEQYGAGDIRVGLQITGEYPNRPAAHPAMKEQHNG